MRIEKNNPHRMFPTLQTGKKEWFDYTAEVSIQRLSLSGMAGMVLCMNHSIDTLVFSLEGASVARLSWRYKEEVRVLCEKEVLYDPDMLLRLCVQLHGDEAV